MEVLHHSDWECDECGGPSPATSMSGCVFCDGQGDIVPRGTARVRRWHPGWRIGEDLRIAAEPEG